MIPVEPSFKAINYNRKEATSPIAKNVEIIAYPANQPVLPRYILFIPFTSVVSHKKVLVGVIKVRFFVRAQLMG